MPMLSRKPFLVVLLVVACGGSAGPQGPQGPAGPPGPAGISVTSAKFCDSQSTLIGGFNLLYQYQVVVYSNGEKLVMCSISDGSGSYAFDAYCRTNSMCVASANCAVTYDADKTSGTFTGFMEYRNDAPGERAIYHDQNSIYDGVTVAFGAANCG
jgi:hypothetical protein